MKTSREDYRRKVEAQLALWESKLAVLEARMERASVDARAALHRHVDELRKLHASARQHAEQVAAGPAHAWNDIKSGLEERWMKLGVAIESVWKRLEPEAMSAPPPGGAEQPARPEAAAPARAAGFQVPSSVLDEHHQIHAALESAMKAPGAIGTTARELGALLHPHFLREEQLAVPPLALLAPLAAGELRAEMLSMIEPAEALRRELPQMLREHESIAALARRLEELARQVGHMEAERLAQSLLAHARSEEEVLYPAAILVGEVLRARSSTRAEG